VDDHAGALIEHHRKQRSVQPDGGKQVQIECAMPLGIFEHRKASAGRGRAAHDVDDDVDSAEAVANSLDDGGAALRCGDVCGDEEIVWS